MSYGVSEVTSQDVGVESPNRARPPTVLGKREGKIRDDEVGKKTMWRKVIKQEGSVGT